MRYSLPLKPEEQSNVRRAVRYLRAHLGTWIAVARAAHIKRATVRKIRDGGRVRPYVARNVSAVAGVSISDLLAGKWPPSEACAHCGRSSTDLRIGER